MRWCSCLGADDEDAWHRGGLKSACLSSAVASQIIADGLLVKQSVLKTNVQDNQTCEGMAPGNAR